MPGYHSQAVVVLDQASGSFGECFVTSDAQSSSVHSAPLSFQCPEELFMAAREEV